jgi:isochorismate synthase
MIDSLTLTAGTLRALRRGVECARLHGAPVLVSTCEQVRDIDPLDVFARAGGQDRIFWSAPDERDVAGIGVACDFPFVSAAETERAWKGLLAHGIVESTPKLFGALPFDPAQPAGGVWQDIPIGRLVLPRFSLEGASATTLTINLLVRPSDDPTELAGSLSWELAELLTSAPPAAAGSGVPLPRDEAHYLRLVADAVAAIRTGTLQKVVAARAQYVEGEWDQVGVLRQLRRAFPRCVTFAVGQGESCFLGATPEWLVRSRGSEARISCLAGTAPRGATTEEDDRLGAELLASRKNRHEHALVLEELLLSLRGIAETIDAPPEPGLMKLPNLQHLYTPIVASVPPGSLLSLAERLHPTPAVAGFPRREALAFLRKHEHLERGGYAGPVGWVDASGDGEFAVALRSGVISGRTAVAFAGCGIVEDSDPACEYAETVLKLRPMLSALGAMHG